MTSHKKRHENDQRINRNAKSDPGTLAISEPNRSIVDNEGQAVRIDDSKQSIEAEQEVAQPTGCQKLCHKRLLRL
ncbi:hypothetical protein QA635_30635 [Bradyrhizobium brasilense]|uniref:hypothetical protein n=1 Tax=Bradyrhizobium brasilense TaxID=1419277 RepID=UPI0024B19F29|nr:hypothetical protein [Bradyrhizobium australafricanum]WFU37225.1 hypothetical protein QA635_30635 [Bradyrhizobium australafricanum]